MTEDITMYKKRAGTGGIRGQLYETKLISLILFRAQHDDNIEDFNIAANMDDIGAFDDICFKAKIKNSSRPLLAFIQAKHRTNNKCIQLNNKNDLVKYFQSYMKIKQKFDLNSHEMIFGGQYDESDCLFIMYTTEKSCKNSIVVDKPYASHLNGLIATGNNGSQPFYTDEEVQYISKMIIKEDVGILAERFAKFLNHKAIITMMSDEYIQRYHVILAKSVVTVSEINNAPYRMIKFRPDFFDTTNEYLVMLRDKLYFEILKNQKRGGKAINTSISNFLSNPSEITLSYVIGNTVIYKDGKFEFVKTMHEKVNEKLSKINLPQSTVKQAIEIGAKYILQQLDFRVPTAFGNTDLLIRGGQDKIEKRINYLFKSIVDLIDKSIPSKIISIDKSVGDGLLQLNGGLGSAVGNILVYDDDTKLLKFTDDNLSPNNLASSLLSKLKDRISDLREYRFDVKVEKLPKLSFDSGSEYLVKDFLSRLVFYADQADENNVEDILKKEIEEHQSIDTHNFRIKSDAIFLKYHDKIQKWWMSPTGAPYFTKASDIYHDAVQSIINNPLLNITSMMYTNKIKNIKNKIDCTFSENAMEPLKPIGNLSKTVIVTDRPMLTVVKVIQRLKVQKYIILDLNYILKMLTNEFLALTSELQTSNNEDIIIIVCENLPNIRSKRLETFAVAVHEKKNIVVTDKIFMEAIEQHWPKPYKTIHDEKHSIIDLNQESQQSILKNTQVIFQGQEISLDLLIDETSIAFIEGAIFNEITLNKPIVIGESLGNPYYDEIKDLHVDRKVYNGGPRSRKRGKVLRTLHDIKKHIVLITAKPGMGKSTLLTHLSLKTKELDKSLWIVRVNLLDHSGQFNKWQKEKTQIDTLETLKFLCQVILKKNLKEGYNIGLVETNGEVCLHDFTGDAWATFELKLFLHYYNRRKLMFLFDGFDEICPYYVEEVISFLNVVKAYPQKHRIWITSRSYNKIKMILQENFGGSFEIEHFDYTEQDIYLDKFWKSRLLINELNDEQLKNISDFKVFMLKTHNTITAERFTKLNKSLNLPLIRVYSHLVEHLQTEGDRCSKNTDLISFTYNVTDLDECLITMLSERKSFEVMLDFVGTPLHLYLVADYLLNEIKDISKNTNKWDLDVNTYTIYEKFLETKLKKIRFQDKNKMDVCNPDIMMTYEKERSDFIAMHKILAAYAIFQRNGFKMFGRNQLKEIKAMIKAIKKGGEKSGLICNVSNDIPQFIHFTFAEYFAVEYVSDLLKTETRIDRKTALWDLILYSLSFNIPSNIGHIMEQKLKMDPELASIVEKNKRTTSEAVEELEPMSLFNSVKSMITTRFNQSGFRR